MKTEHLRATSFPLGDDIDLLDHYGVTDGFYFERNGTGIVTVGVAARIDVPAGPDHVERIAAEANRALRAIDGDGAVAVGAVGFDGRGGASLIIPQAAIVRRAGRTRLVIVGRAGMPEPNNPLRVLPQTPAELRSVEPFPSPDTYRASVRFAVEQIRAGMLSKVVLARTLTVTTDHDFDIPTLLERLRIAEPDAFVFATPALVGASPELLVERDGARVRTQPLAGTIARTGDDAQRERQLLASQKDRAEHGFVVDAVREALSPVCSTLDDPHDPTVVHTSKVIHLATAIEGTLATPAPSALALAARLHPTPAVCGTPPSVARELIASLEGFDRGLYAGAVGWMDADGDGTWAVALRCATVEGPTARLYAGAGIVEGSDPDDELAETDAKFRSMLDALGYA